MDKSHHESFSGLSFIELKQFLDEKVLQYNNTKFIESDPIQIPHLFSRKEDPLSSLVGWTELLKDQDIPENYITEIENDINRLKKITDRFSKIGSTPTLTPMDIVALTRETCRYLESRSSNLIAFDIDLPDTTILVALNAELFSWTLENLVKNGIDAMRGQGTISIGLSAQNKRVLLHISDSGKGIPKRYFNKIFRPGFTTKKRGWGLGLSLARRIVEDYHRGKIRVLKSIKDQGSTLEINLPEVT